ncbi:olfactory receptor 151-like [Protopterus annectens]|uniref:olfactory receptor 151-like n=1 Tax=Protopterus annectens TaxID=7888 RepID=UPI001CF993C3|nr:olfactory receptor 151-like [Protopterus annectens]
MEPSLTPNEEFLVTVNDPNSSQDSAEQHVLAVSETVLATTSMSQEELPGSLVFYLLIMFCNTSLITVIAMNKNLYEPMYIFVCNLCLNGLCGSTAIFPKLMADIISEAKVISQAECLIQMLFEIIFSTNELSLLTVMAYDRYVSICNPLRYVSLVTKRKICTLLILPWLYSFCFAISLIFQVFRLPLCSKFIADISCNFQAYIKLSCTDVSVSNMYETSISIIHAFTLMAVIVYSYVQIFKVCYRASKRAKSKALNTCMTHFLLLFVHLFAGLLGFYQVRTGGGTVDFVHFFVSLSFFMTPPLFNPLIYGIRTQEIRKTIQKVITNRTLCPFLRIKKG